MRYGGAEIISGTGPAKSADFDYSFSFKDQDDERKTKFDNYPGGLFTMPNPSNNVAFNHSTGGREDGAFNA